LPRLSAPIVNISCSADNQRYAVFYVDNGYYLSLLFQPQLMKSYMRLTL